VGVPASAGDRGGRGGREGGRAGARRSRSLTASTRGASLDGPHRGNPTTARGTGRTHRRSGAAM